MTNPESEKSSIPPEPPAPPQEPIKAPENAAPAREEPSPPPKTVRRIKRVKNESEDPRRGFFSDAMREVLSPFAGLLEKKINPLLEAIEAIPSQAERMADSGMGILDQPGARSIPLQQKKKKHEDRYLRPPGAMAPGQFESVCSRCGKCVEACPANAIKLDPNGLLADGFPYIIAQNQPCVVCDELACMNVCPTGALKLVDRRSINIGTAKVDHHTCLRDNGENCTLCVDVCPIQADDHGNLAAITISPITGKVIVRKNICVGCGLCEERCPTDPRSIIVIPFAAPHDPIIA